MNATHHVHIYTVIRVKVAVEAGDQHDALKRADQVFSAQGFPVRLVPVGEHILDAEPADEVIGYLVDEVDDPEFLRSTAYDVEFQPCIPGKAASQ
ncbi:hypothetical protein [uncultured Sphingomonas sp.]|uniref:hypothetical protein n=1 Tax=uncultured Sphingomonas sp. TaxID=158754 RepID=UPI00262A3AD6|nr:hypothetical protein [uncultured Sphingomonas sp.]